MEDLDNRFKPEEDFLIEEESPWPLILSEMPIGERQLVFASQMRNEAVSLLPRIRGSVEPTQLIFTSFKEKSPLAEVPESHPKQTGSIPYNLLSPTSQLDAWLIDPRLQRIEPFIKNSRYDTLFIFAPLLLGNDGKIWKIDAHRIIVHNELGYQQLSDLQVKYVQEGYRSRITGSKLSGYSKILDTHLAEGSNPRLATDNDLIPLQTTSLESLELKEQNFVDAWSRGLLDLKRARLKI